MRVSDAERTEMADTLSKHYADGRLDDGEFKVRLDKAMGAKTRADLNGLLVDLPPVHAVGACAAGPASSGAHGGRSWCSAFVALAIGVTSSIVSYHVPWLLIALVLFFVWRSGRFHHRQLITTCVLALLGLNLLELGLPELAYLSCGPT